MDQKDTYNTNQEELEEALSLCDLPLENQVLDPFDHHPPTSPSHELFEFPFTLNTFSNNKDDIVFCGKLIKEQDFDDLDDQSRYLFPLSSARLLNSDKKDLGSLCLAKSKPNSALSTKFFKSQSCSSSSSSRKHKVLIGLAKIPPKMELSDIKKRQSRRNPSPMFPPVAAGDLEVVAAGDGCGGRRRGHHWGLVRPLRCRANLATALAKASLGCIPHV
ncbi:PREDICTED: uncharacterized protein LOC18586356 [Theobroma cacao]|uniref:Uncharacterized protein LOC18586356 n=1 Tax=Theobroma cacao TaxID=3641 RepID=A0AB32ULV1_THECC|nr:PREDICTED: uncharacterized protein LOC18586356 [Theobroma cacao]